MAAPISEQIFHRVLICPRCASGYIQVLDVFGDALLRISCQSCQCSADVSRHDALLLHRTSLLQLIRERMEADDHSQDALKYQAGPQVEKPKPTVTRKLLPGD